MEAVVLSGAASSPGEDATQSKDPYQTRCRNSEGKVFRVLNHASIGKLMGSLTARLLCSG